MEGGSAQKGDDITTQPFDELFPLPLQLRSEAPGSDWGPGAASLDEGATEVSSIMLQTAGKGGAGQADPTQREVGRWLTHWGLILRLGEKFCSAAGELGSSFPSLQVTGKVPSKRNVLVLF